MRAKVFGKVCVPLRPKDVGWKETMWKKKKKVHVVSFKSFVYKIIWNPAETPDLSLVPEPSISPLRKEEIFGKTR